MSSGAGQTATLVGVAVVLRDEYCLVGVRSAGQVLAGRAEFPGGKCELGESFAECAARETLEETGLEVVPRRCLRRVDHTYDHGTVRIEFWQCDVSNRAVDRAPTPPFNWVPIEMLASLPFPEANREIIRELVSQGGGNRA
ncbi:MAG: NUDIX domain-containing protein [Planctomycetaceae bacterium]|nr:NUDIX domain-containing protein [Planctomycetaceae bacterium]